MIICICGHILDKHCQNGCMAVIDKDSDKFCYCELTRAEVELASAKAERDEAIAFSRGQQVIIEEQRRQLTEAQRAIDVLSNTVVAQDAEIKRLRQQREDVEQYRAEIEQAHQREESLCDEIEKRNEIIRGYADRLSEATA